MAILIEIAIKSDRSRCRETGYYHVVCKTWQAVRRCICGRLIRGSLADHFGTVHSDLLPHADNKYKYVHVQYKIIPKLYYFNYVNLIKTQNTAAQFQRSYLLQLSINYAFG